MAKTIQPNKVKQAHRDQHELLFLRGAMKGLTEEGYSIFQRGRRLVFIARIYWDIIDGETSEDE